MMLIYFKKHTYVHNNMIPWNCRVATRYYHEPDDPKRVLASLGEVSQLFTAPDLIQNLAMISLARTLWSYSWVDF